MAPKKSGAFELSVQAKRELIDAGDTKLSISQQCELLALPRSSYYRSAMCSESAENLTLMRLIDEVYLQYPFYGSRQMCSHLNRHKGYGINRKRVQRLMRLIGLVSVAPGPHTSQPGKGKHHQIYPYLLRGRLIDRPNQVWCTDITYIPMKHGFVYLVAVMDWYSRHVLAWEVSNSMDESFCVSALERALRLYETPEIFNSDQGAQFTGKAFTDVLKANDIRISMDGKGRAMDNIFIERLWRSVKYEEVYLKEYGDVEQLRQSLKKYFHFYNALRPHQTFGGMTPQEVYEGKYVGVDISQKEEANDCNSDTLLSTRVDQLVAEAVS